MLVEHRHANETLVLLQCAANTAYVSMLAMHSDATTDPSAAPAMPAPPVVRLDADLTAVRGELATVRPTMITKYVIERRWCPQCRTYHEDAVTAALPRHRLGLHVLLFVVYQKVALGLSYGKIRHELRTYFGLTVSAGELPGMVAEIAAVFGPAYARLLELMRQQAAIHIDETSWRVDGVPHWLWVFVNDVVALYVVSRSRGSKVPQALLGPDFDGVVISDFFSAYAPLDVAKAQCWAHLLRDSYDYAKGQDADSERLQVHP